MFIIQLCKESLKNEFCKKSTGHMENFDKPFENTETDPGKLSIAFYSGIFSYAGWYDSFKNFIHI